MIHSEEKYAGTIVPTLLAFGKGDIAIMPAQSADGYAHVMFKNSEPHEIGSEGSDYKEGCVISDIDPEVMMVFDKVESIEVVIWALEEARATLIGVQSRS